jgi:hypothetical protein
MSFAEFFTRLSLDLNESHSFSLTLVNSLTVTGNFSMRIDLLHELSLRSFGLPPGHLIAPP